MPRIDRIAGTNAQPMLNPLLTDYQLPPFDRIRPEHAEPAVRTLLDGNRRQLAALLDAGRRRLGRPRRADRAHASRARARLVADRSPEQRDERRGAARGVQRLPAAAHQLSHRAGAERARCAPPTSAFSTGRARGSHPSSASSSRMRCATSGWRASSLPADRKQRFREVMERLAQRAGEVRRERARCDQCLVAGGG